MQSPKPHEYKKRIIELLESPERIWSHAFDNQISDRARNLLFALYTLGHWVNVKDLESAFDSIHRGFSTSYNRQHGPDDFRLSLQELDGAFLNYSSGMAVFVNPSVREFTAGVIARSPAVATALFDAAVRFKQVFNLWDLAQDRIDQPLFGALAADRQNLRLNVERLLYANAMEFENGVGGFRAYQIDLGQEERLTSLANISDALQSDEFVETCLGYADWLIDYWTKRQISFYHAVRVLEVTQKGEWFVEHGGRPILRKLLDAMLSHLELADADDWLDLLDLPESFKDWTSADKATLDAELQLYQSKGVLEERRQCSGVDELVKLAGSLTQLRDVYKVDFGSGICSIEQEVDYKKKSEPSDEAESGDGGYANLSTVSRGDTTTEEEVRQIFQALRT